MSAGSGTEPPDPVRLAYAGLLRVSEPPTPALVRFVAAVGPIAAWDAVRGRDESVTGPEVLDVTGPRTSGRSPQQLDAIAERDLERAAAVGAAVIGADDPEWPRGAFDGLDYIRPHPSTAAAAPLALYVRGRGLAVVERSVAVVGSRAATPYGLRAAADLAADLVGSGMTVVSGAAFGIDAAAHRGALHGGRGGRGGEPRRPLASPDTVAVLACGIDRAYPVAHAGLIDAVAHSGAVVSEYPPGTTPARHRFLVRNRLIAALTAGTVVVEAGARSGSLNTATAAEFLSRHTMAMPGPITSAVSLGCHDLIRDRNAHLVTNARDVIALLGPLAPDDPQLFDVPAAPERPADGLDHAAGLVYEALPARGRVTVVELSVESALPGRAVLGALGLLEVEGLVERADGGWRRSR